MKLSTYHRDLCETIARHGIRASAAAAGLNAMRVSRFVRTPPHQLGRVPIEDWIILTEVVAELRGRNPEADLANLQLV